MIPKFPSEITVEYLKEKLQDNHWIDKLSSISYNHSNIQGQCSQVVLFKLLDSEENIIQEIYIKFAKDENEKSIAHHVDRNFLVETSAYKKEIGFYQYLLNIKSDLLSRKVVPPVYLAEIDRNNKDQFILILGKSGKALDQIVGCSTEEIRLIMREWALVQSKFWYCRESEEVFREALSRNGFDVMTPLHYTITSMINKRNHCLPVPEAIEELKQVWKTRWEDYQIVLKYFSSHVGSSTRTKQMEENIAIMEEQVNSGRIFELIEEGCEILNSENNTINHCDFRLDNMLHVSDNSVAFVDFQCLAFGSCAYDLSFFLSSCLLSEQVNDNFDNLMESYWTSLIESNSEIEKTYSIQQLKRETRKTAIIQLTLYLSMFSNWRPMIDSGVDLKGQVGRFFTLVICATERMLNFHTAFTSSD